MVELAGRFVAAADEVGRLQRGDDWECRLFRQLAEQGHYAGRTEPSDTRQGIYAAAPGGVLLGSINTRDPRKLARMLEQALEKWSGLTREQRIGAPAPADAPSRRERQYPEDGLVLEVVARDVERKPETLDWTAHAWNRDFAWFTRAEARSLVPAEIAAGAEQPWPAALAQRLVRCHLVDDVRGQVPAFAREAVERAEILTRVEAVDGDVVRLSLRGATRAAQTGHWPVQGFEDGREPKEQSRGFEAELEGRAVFDRAAGRFTSFELVAIGSRWGGTQFNGRGGDLDPAPMGVALVLDADGPRVAPALIWEY